MKSSGSPKDGIITTKAEYKTMLKQLQKRYGIHNVLAFLMTKSTIPLLIEKVKPATTKKNGT